MVRVKAYLDHTIFIYLCLCTSHCLCYAFKFKYILRFQKINLNIYSINDVGCCVQDPYLALTGPARAPVSPIHFEIILKVKHTNESEDKYLSLIAERYECCESIDYQAREYALRSCVSSKKYKSKLSTVELTCGIVASSIEATISVRVVEGSWPDGFSGRFTAFTVNVSHMKVSLLEFEGGSVPVSAADGTIELSRRVVSVESFGELRICAAALQGSSKVEHEVLFEPVKSGRSSNGLIVGSCKMEVTVGWSLLPLAYPTARISSSNGEASKVG